MKRGARRVSLHAIAVDTWPDAPEGSSGDLVARRTGRATSSFAALDDDMARELTAFPERLHRPYREHHARRSAS